MCDRFLLLLCFFASVTHTHDKCIRIAGSNAVPRFHVGVTDTLPCLIQIEKSYCDAPANRNAIRWENKPVNVTGSMQRISAEGGKVASKLGQRSVLA